MSDNNPIAENSEKENNHDDQETADTAQERGNTIAPDIQGRTESSSKRGQNPTTSQLAPNPDLETPLAEGGSEEGPASREGQGKARGETSKAVAEAKAGIRQEETSGGEDNTGWDRRGRETHSITTTTRPKPRGAGRPSELERRPDLKERIVAYLSAGNRIETVCGLVNITPQMFSEWIARGEDRHPDRPMTPLFAEFAEAVKKAQGFAEASRLQRIEKAAKGGDVSSVTRYYDKQGNLVSEKTSYTSPQWQADAWWMERAIPEAWGRRLDINAKILTMNNEQLKQFIAEGLRRNADAGGSIGADEEENEDI